VTGVPAGPAGESAWDKLRRRKVVQSGIVYAAGAWGLLQGLEYVTSTFDWPRQVQQFATLGLLIGLPVVLVTAWYHGDQGRQRVSAAELTIITLLFLVGGGIFWRYDKASDAPSPTTASGTTDPAAVPAADAKIAAASIAMLPFADLSQSGDQGYFSDGMAEEILNVLARVKGLQVASRTSSFAFKDQEDLGIPAIARQLDVRHVLEGSVRRAGGTIRITAQLIDADVDRHLWSETFDRRLHPAPGLVASNAVAHEGQWSTKDYCPHPVVAGNRKNLNLQNCVAGCANLPVASTGKECCVSAAAACSRMNCCRSSSASGRKIESPSPTGDSSACPDPA
jgi:TolB-like protein